MKHVVILDIDGTLTETMALDSELYCRAVEEVLGLSGINTDWSRYRHVTDEGITAEIIERRLDRPAHPHDTLAIRERFMELMRVELAARPERCRPLGGAARMLETLADHDRFAAAIATGAWLDSALLKTSHAGLDIERFPVATSEDSPQREAIVQTSLKRARERYELSAGGRAICVGDGVWDLAAARRLGLGFVGVGSGRVAERLRDAARDVVEDFTDLPGFLSLLESAGQV